MAVKCAPNLPAAACSCRRRPSAPHVAASQASLRFDVCRQGPQSVSSPMLPNSMASNSNIPALVRRLRSPRRLEQVQAAEALARLLPGSLAAVQALVDAGGGAALARMVVSGSSQAAQRAAARALNAANTTVATLGDRAAVQFARQAGEEVEDSLPAVLAMLRSSDGELQGAAACLAYSVAVSRQQLRSAVVDSGGPAALLGCLRQLREAASASAQAEQLEYSSGYCAVALAMLCESNCEVQPAIAAAGGAALLVNLLSSSSHLVQLGAAQALQWLAEGCPEGQQAAAAAGAIPALTQLLASSTVEDISIAATHALLALRPQWLTDVQQVACSIPALVRILQHSLDSMGPTVALSMLYRICQSGGLPELCAMAAAGAAPALQHYLAIHGQDGSVPGHVEVASALLDALSGLPDR